MRTNSLFSLTRTLLEILSENEDKRWTPGTLIREAGGRTGYDNHSRWNLIIRTLCGADRVEHSSRGDRVRVLWFKPQLDEGAVNTIREQAKEVSAKLKAELAAAKAEAKEAREAQQVDKVIEVHTYKTAKTRKPKKLKELFHDEFETILTLAKARRNIFIYGPTGCGKSHICEQIAKALDLPYAFVSCTAGMSEGVLGGRLLPVGAAGRFEYVISRFIDCYENGGLFLLDEMDAADPNVLLLINAALANGKVAVPNRPKKPVANRHADFICIAAANTVGTGADRMYSGRNKLDGATLDRFRIGMVHMDYNTEVETGLCGLESRIGFKTKPGSHYSLDSSERELNIVEWCYCVRNAINEHRLERAMSTRFIKDAHLMEEEFGWSRDQIAKAYFCGWREDEANKVQNSVLAQIEEHIHTV